MILKIYTVYDSKVEAYLRPFFMQSRGEAIRAFTDAVNDQNTQFNKHPEDFTLFELGMYDDQNGGIEMHTAKVSLGTAVEFKDNNDSSASVRNIRRAFEGKEVPLEDQE